MESELKLLSKHDLCTQWTMVASNTESIIDKFVITYLSILDPFGSKCQQVDYCLATHIQVITSILVVHCHVALQFREEKSGWF